MAQQSSDAVRRLQHQAGKLPQPVSPGVKTFDELPVELFQPLFGSYRLRHKDKVHAVHQLPALLENAFIMDCPVKGGAWKRGKLGQVHVVKFQPGNEVGGHLDRLFRFTRQADHKERQRARRMTRVAEDAYAAAQLEETTGEVDKILERHGKLIESYDPDA